VEQLLSLFEMKKFFANWTHNTG